VPRVRARIAHDAVAIGIPIELQLARIRITLETLAPRSDDVKAIKVPVLKSGYEAAPELFGVFNE